MQSHQLGHKSNTTGKELQFTDVQKNPANLNLVNPLTPKSDWLTWTHLLKPPANLNKTWFPLTQFFSYLLPTHPNNFLFSLGVWVGMVLLYVFVGIGLVPINVLRWREAV